MHVMIRLFDALVTGVVNIGFFYYSLCIGNLISSRCKLVMPNWVCAVFISLEILASCAIAIFSIAYFDEHNPELDWLRLLIIMCLGLIHSILSTHFDTLRPPKKVIPLKYQG